VTRTRAGKPSPKRPPPPSAKRRTWVLPVVLVAVAGIVVLVQAPVLRAQAFCFDDHQYVFTNPLVQKPGWESVGRFLREILRPSTVQGYYQPMGMISLMLDWAAGGRPDDLRVFHRTSLALHGLNAVLVALLVYRCFGHVGAAAAAGLLFGLHPVTVEPVAWISERKTLLASVFALACLNAYLWYVARPTVWRYATVAAFLALALLSKPIATPLPVLLLLLDWWPLHRLGRQAVVEKLPLFALSAAAGVITLVSQARAAGLDAPTDNDPARIFWTLCHNAAFYPIKLLWPAKLMPHYPFPEPLGPGQPLVLAGLVGTLVAVVLVCLSWRWTRAVVVGALFFVLTLLPTTNIIGFTHAIAALKFLYLPLVGWLLPLGALWAWLWRPVAPPRWGRAGIAVAAVLVLAALEAYAARRYLDCWQDTERLHRHMVQVAPHAWAARYNLGEFLAQSGRTSEAIEQFERVLAQRPDHWKARSALGAALWRVGQCEAALAQLREAVRLKPSYFPAQFNLAAVLAECGQKEAALRQYRQVVETWPAETRARVNLANLLLSAGRPEDALRELEEALRLEPSYVRAHFNRGLVLRQLGRLDDAQAAFRRTLELDPNHAKAREQLELLDSMPTIRRVP